MAGLSRETRGLIVSFLTKRGMSPQEIATELGVSRETVRRDLHNPSPVEVSDASADAVPDVRPATTHGGDILVIPIDEPVRQSLATLRATRGCPDTVAQNAAAARAAIRAMADTILEARQ